MAKEKSGSKGKSGKKGMGGKKGCQLVSKQLSIAPKCGCDFKFYFIGFSYEFFRKGAKYKVDRLRVVKMSVVLVLSGIFLAVIVMTVMSICLIRSVRKR